VLAQATARLLATVIDQHGTTVISGCVNPPNPKSNERMEQFHDDIGEEASGQKGPERPLCRDDSPLPCFRCM
jgi:hypothetical protein